VWPQILGWTCGVRYRFHISLVACRSKRPTQTNFWAGLTGARELASSSCVVLGVSAAEVAIAGRAGGARLGAAVLELAAAVQVGGTVLRRRCCDELCGRHRAPVGVAAMNGL